MRPGGVTVRRFLRSGARDEAVRLPRGWEVLHLRAQPAQAPLKPEALPAPRSVAVPRGPLLVVVNDAQRATPTPWLMDLLDLDWESPAVRIAVATGCHAPPDEGELRQIFGGHLERVRRRVHVHRAAVDPLSDFGATRRGTPVQVNRIVDGASAIVCLGSVEPHYFAGWTGGRKGLVPGLCSLETMRANHRLAVDPRSALCALEGNPLHLDLVEAVGMIGSRLAAHGVPAPLGVNAIVAGGAIHGWHAGPLSDSVEALAPQAGALFGRRVDTPAALVLCFVDHPLDRDLYQALKGLEHWKSAVDPGGVLALVADCPHGIGPPAFTQFLGTGASAAELERRAQEHYRLGDHKLLSFLRFLESGRQAWLVSPTLAGRADIPLRTFGSVLDAVEAAGLGAAAGSRTIVVEDAATVVPLHGICS